MRVGNPEDPTPLTPQAFHLLLAVAGGQNNAYGLIGKVAEDSGNSLHLAPGSIYPSLKRLVHLGYLEQGNPMPSPGRLGETSIYRLTSLGRMVLEWELDRYERAVGLGRERLR